MWELIVSVIGNTIQHHDRTEKSDVCHDQNHAQGQQSRGMFNVLKNVDRAPSNAQFSNQEGLLYVFEDNEAESRENSGKKSHNETSFQEPQSCT